MSPRGQYGGPLFYPLSANRKAELLLERLGCTVDGSIALSRTFVAPAFTSDKKSRCDIKFVKWLVRKNRALTMSKKDDELNEFIDEVTDGAYTLSCLEVILKLVKQMQAWEEDMLSGAVRDEASEDSEASYRRSNKVGRASPAGVVAHHARGCSFQILFRRTQGCNLAHGL